MRQDSLRLSPELELIIKAWPDLSDEAREKIMDIIVSENPPPFSGMKIMRKESVLSELKNFTKEEGG